MVFGVGCGKQLTHPGGKVVEDVLGIFHQEA
jgi:hypothetical protein